jgi:hypothetical protein
VTLLARFALLLALVVAAAPVHAESLRCYGAIADVGDSRIAVLYKCGPPLLRDSYCAPVFYPGGVYPVPEPYASLIAPCLATEDWVYDRGPGNLVATVRFRFGVVQSIHYGRSPP